MGDKLHLPFEITQATANFLEEIFNDFCVIDFVGVFFCMQGYIEVSIDYKQYSISKGDMFIYTPSLYVHIIRYTDDFSGIAIRTDYNYVIPLMNKVIDIRSQLLLRDNPCFSLTDKQYSIIKQQIMSLWNRMEQEKNSEIDKQRGKIITELIMSQGATLFYELINICFISHKLEPIEQDRSGIIFQKFMISLYHHYKVERNVVYYAREQYLSPSYFSVVIKQKT